MANLTTLAPGYSGGQKLSPQKPRLNFHISQQLVTLADRSPCQFILERCCNSHDKYYPKRQMGVRGCVCVCGGGGVLGLLIPKRALAVASQINILCIG